MDKGEIQQELIIPYNINNIIITPKDIYDIFYNFDNKLNVQAKNIELYIEALTHKSYIKSQYTMYHSSDLKKIKSQMSKDVLELRDKSSERLEFYGDTVIKNIVAKYLLFRYNEEDEGFLTRIKTKIENRKSLALFARKLGIQKFLIISQQIELNNGRDSNKLLEDAFEAFIGSLDIDVGHDICEQFLFRLLEEEIDYPEILYKDTNFKDKLLRYFHQNNWSHPIYEDNGTYTFNNKKYFIVNVKNNLGKVIATATESSKKRAEQKVSMYALLIYKQLNNDQIVDEFDT
jgi:dsRNA-specific ribonuclease